MVRPLNNTSSTSTTVFPVHVERDFRRMNFWRGALIQIVAVHGNVEAANRHGNFPNVRKNFSKPVRERHAAIGNSDEHDCGAEFSLRSAISCAMRVSAR